jgi:hypothetical protein
MASDESQIIKELQRTAVQRTNNFLIKFFTLSPFITRTRENLESKCNKIKYLVILVIKLPFPYNIL